MDTIDSITPLSQPPVEALVALAMVGVIGTFGVRRFGVYAWYVVVLAVAAIVAPFAGTFLYFWTFVLGAATAFTEIITKFRDEPLKAFKTAEAVCYHIFNGLVAAFALYALMLSGVKLQTEPEQVQAVLGAGLGSMLLMRSKFFNIKVGDEDVSFGPEQFVKVFLGFMEKAIDRVRAQARIDFIHVRMKNIDCDKIQYYCITMLEAAQLLEDTAREGLKNKIQQICARTTEDKQLRAYELGFALSNAMGEGFVTRIFSNVPAEYRSTPAAGDGGLAMVQPGPLTQPAVGSSELYYFAYGRDMCTQVLQKRLGWSREAAEQQWRQAKPTQAILKGYRLVFGKPDSDNPEAGLATLETDPTQAVEGVLYRLPASVTDRLDTKNDGCQRITVLPQQGAQTLEAQAYVAIQPQPMLKPIDEYVVALLAGAREHGLSAAYIQRLEQTERLEQVPTHLSAEPPATESTVPAPPSVVDNVPGLDRLATRTHGAHNRHVA